MDHIPGISDVALRARLLATLLANLDGMVYRCLPDNDWSMQFVSQGAQALTGYPVESFLSGGGATYEEIIHPDDRAFVRETVFRAVAQGTRFELEYRIVRAGGMVRWVLECGTGIFSTNGDLQALEGFIQDVTRRVDADVALREAERRYRSIFENAAEGIFRSTPNDGFVAANPALVRMLGFDSAEQLIAEWHDIGRKMYVEPQRRNEFMQALNDNGAITNFESRVYKRSGDIIWVSQNARAVRSASDELQFYEGTIEDITERKRYETEIRRQATHDALTGLPNRALLYDRIQQAVAHALRDGNLVAVVFVDLDQFKLVNDSLGHQAGDDLLKTVANRLSQALREGDTVARQGGDEFALVLPNQTNEELITNTMQRVLLEVSKPWLANGLEFQVTCSMGVSLCPADGRDADTLLKNADADMYRAKELGRNNFQYFGAEMNSSAVDRLALLNRLRRALADQRFLLHYQPKIDLVSGKLAGMEALVRWDCLDRGLVSPGEFIPLAEETGLIHALGEWVLHTACAQNQAWQKAGFAAIPVSVNLSPRQLERGDIVELVTCALVATGLAPECLELEITESVVMRDVEKTFATLARLKALGVKISIDDFGTGYSSLNYLKRFPVDTLKIDQAFVRDIADQSAGAAIVKAIISLAHILNLKVLAEGVETEEQYRYLQANGCDEAQGYYFGRPIAAEDFWYLLQPKSK